MYQVLNKQVPVPVPVPVVQVPVLNLQVPVPVPVPNLKVPVQVLCINYRHSVTLQLHKVKVVVSFIFKKRTVRTNELQTQIRHNRIFLVLAG